MTRHPSDVAGSGIGPLVPMLVQVISYCPAPQSDLQLSVPPDTPPSSPFTVAPLLTSQTCPGRPAWQPDIDPSLVSAFAGYEQAASWTLLCCVVSLPPQPTIAITAKNMGRKIHMKERP